MVGKQSTKIDSKIDIISSLGWQFLPASSMLSRFQASKGQSLTNASHNSTSPLITIRLHWHRVVYKDGRKAGAEQGLSVYPVGDVESQVVERAVQGVKLVNVGFWLRCRRGVDRA